MNTHVILFHHVNKRESFTETVSLSAMSSAYRVNTREERREAI